MADTTPDPIKIKELWEKGVQRRGEVDREAWESIAFIANKHYYTWDSSTRTFRRPANNAEAKLRINLVKAFWRGELATVLESNPVPEVLPSSDDELDKQAATISSRMLEHELRRLHFPLVRIDLFTWVLSAGLGYLHVTWNPQTKEIELETVPLFEVVPDPTCRTSLDQGLWVVHARNLSTEDAYEQYGKEFRPEQGIEVHSWGSTFSGQLFDDQKPDQAVQVFRMWHKPSRRYPQGFLRTVIAGEVIEDKPFPFKHGELPFIDFHHIRLPGRFEGQAMITDLISPQRDYNQSRSRAAEIRALTSAPGWLVQEGTMEAERITVQPGEVITFRASMFKPEQLQPPQAPAHLFQSMGNAYSEMQDIAGQHDVSRGMSPGSGTAASAIIALQEKDQRKLATTIRAAEVGWSKMGKQLLELVQQYWTTQRMVRVWSEEEGSHGAYFYKGADLRNQTDVHIVPGSSEPKSESQQQELLLSLWRERLLVDPNPVLERMNIPGIRKYIQKTNLDIQQARREHDRIFEGDIVEPDMRDNHEVHIAEHGDFRKQELFEAWPPELRNALVDHLAKHEALLEQQIQDELQKQAAQQTLLGPTQNGSAMQSAPAEPQAPIPAGG